MTRRLHSMLAAHIGSELATRGIRPDDLRPLETYTDAETVLLVGSYARGEATTESDLDIAILCDEVPDRPAGTPGYASVVGESVIAGSAGGMVLTVEYLRRDMVRRIRAVLGGIPGSPDSPSMANLGALELRTLERVGTGILLQQAETDRDLVGGIDLERARANKAALAFRLAVGHLRAAADQAADPAAAALRRGEAVQSLLIAEANAAGTLTFDTKHLLRRIGELPAGPAVTVLRRLRDPAVDSHAMTADLHTACLDFLARARLEPARALIWTLLTPAVGVIEAMLRQIPRSVS